MIETAAGAGDDPVLPPEPPDGTWLHLPDLHRSGYADVLHRDDAASCDQAIGDPRRGLLQDWAAERGVQQDHWWSFHRRTWLDWPTAVRLGAATARALHLTSPPASPNPAAAADAARGVQVDPRSVETFKEYGR